jgi:hypothetical protein
MYKIIFSLFTKTGFSFFFLPNRSYFNLHICTQTHTINYLVRKTKNVQQPPQQTRTSLRKINMRIRKSILLQNFER